MTAAEGTLARALDFVARALAPLEQAVSTPAAALGLLHELGLDAPAAPPSLVKLGPAVSALGAKLTAFEAAVAQGEASPAAASALADLGGAAAAVFQAISALPAQLQADLAAYPDLLAAVDLGALARRLADYLLISAAAAEAPAAYDLLLALGVIQADPVDDDGGYVPPYVHYAIRGDRLRQLSRNPGAVAGDVYGWATPQFDAAPLLERLEYLLFAAGYATDTYAADDDGNSAVPGLPLTPAGPELRVPLYSDAAGDAAVSFAVGLLPVTTAEGSGLALRPVVTGALSETFALGRGVTLTLGGSADLTAPVALTVTAPGGLALQTGGAAAGATVSVALGWQPEDGARPRLLHEPDWLSIDLAGITAGLAVTESGGTLTIGLEAGLLDGSLTLTPAAADGFIKSALPATGLSSHFTFALTWSPQAGLGFKGSGGASVTIPVNESLGGVVDVDSLYVALDFAPGPALTLTLAVSAGLELGPISAAVDKIGVTVGVTFPPQGGNLGPANAGIAFKAPDGAGLALDAGVVTGGGYIQCDAAKGQYAGILELALESLSLTAIGLIQTKNADGSPLPGGFSLLVIIAVEFLPPVELGFGFSLNGVGGILGLNRTINPDALRSGVRGGSLSDILFPADPVGHAPQLVQALAGFFPAAPGRFLIGPMIEIQWGSPLPVLTAELGVMIELPAPIRVAVMGVLNVGLPQAGPEAVVRLNLDALGLIDFGAGELSLDASLYDSKIADFAISGDMALRFGWKPAVREFVLSLGGFFPSFTPPPGFPALKRLTLSLSSGDDLTFTLQAYLAVTSNTVQFGSKAQLAVTAGSVSLAGLLSFDALIHLSPFGLQVNFAAALTVKVAGNELLGIAVSGQLSGPGPWLISGQASVRLLFISVSVSFAAQLGSGTPPPPPAPVRVIDLLGADLANPACWSALPPSGEAAVTVTPPAGGPQLYAHPLGSLVFHQRTAPLGLTLQKYGSAAVDGPAKLAITSLAYGGDELAPCALTAVDDAFAPAQYLSLSDSDALSQPAFASYQAGVALAPAAPDYDQLAAGETTTVGYAVEVIDSHGEPPPAATATLGPQAAARLVATGAAARARVRTTGARRYQGTPGDIAVRTGAPAGPVMR